MQGERRANPCSLGEPDSLLSDITPEGRRETHLDTILLNGNNVAILVRPQQPGASLHSHLGSGAGRAALRAGSSGITIVLDV